jgi:thiosulfate dehydrogenase
MKRAGAVFMFVASCLFAAAGCGGGGKGATRPARDLGEQLFRDRSLSTSSYNRFSCSTCHGTEATEDPAVTLSAFTLHDSATRPSWFLGYSTQYLDAVNFCLIYFMRGEAIQPGDPNGDALYEYLASISPDASAPAINYTFVRTLTALPAGEGVHGKVVYDSACRICHGDKDSGAGRISSSTTILNAQLSADYDTLFPGTDHNIVVTEKVRHGQFYGIGGNMPFFASEKLSDTDLSDLEAYLNL